METLSQFKTYQQGRKKHKARERLLTGGKGKKVKYNGKTYNVGEARPSRVGNKKWEREVTWIENGKSRKKKVSYGYRGMKDYTQHKDDERRRRFRARASGIKDGNGNLTKNNPLSPNYYNLRDTW